MLLLHILATCNPGVPWVGAALCHSVQSSHDHLSVCLFFLISCEDLSLDVWFTLIQYNLICKFLITSAKTLSHIKSHVQVLAVRILLHGMKRVSIKIIKWCIPLVGTLFSEGMDRSLHGTMGRSQT